MQTIWYANNAIPTERKKKENPEELMHNNKARLSSFLMNNNNLFVKACTNVNIQQYSLVGFHVM